MNDNELTPDLLWDLRRPMANTDLWKPTHYKVGCCGDVIHSARPGAFCSCQCGKSFVDQTREYVRCGGPKDFEVVDQDTGKSDD